MKGRAMKQLYDFSNDRKSESLIETVKKEFEVKKPILDPQKAAEYANEHGLPVPGRRKRHGGTLDGSPFLIREMRNGKLSDRKWVSCSSYGYGHAFMLVPTGETRKLMEQEDEPKNKDTNRSRHQGGSRKAEECFGESSSEQFSGGDHRGTSASCDYSQPKTAQACDQTSAHGVKPRGGWRWLELGESLSEHDQRRWSAQNPNKWAMKKKLDMFADESRWRRPIFEGKTDVERAILGEIPDKRRHRPELAGVERWSCLRHDKRDEDHWLASNIPGARSDFDTAVGYDCMYGEEFEE